MVIRSSLFTFPPDRRAILNGVAQEFRAPPALESGNRKKDRRDPPSEKTQEVRHSQSQDTIHPPNCQDMTLYLAL